MEARTSGVGALDTLIDGVRVGDNLVMVICDDLLGEWMADRFAAAADPSRLIVVDATGRHLSARDDGHVLDWSRAGGVSADQARAELAETDRRVGTGATYAVDSLSTLAEAWGDEAALDLFLWACPRLYRRGSVALWLVDRDRHGEAFIRRLTEITQVVVSLRGNDGGVHLEVVKADGRPRSVLGRTVAARLVDGELIDAHPAGPYRQRLGESLRALRAAQGVGQADLARRVGITPSALSQAERGVRGVSAETLIRIWEALGVPFGPGDPLLRGYRVNRRSGQTATKVTRGVTGRQLSDDPAATVWQLSIGPRAAGRTPLFPVKAAETVIVLRGVLQVDLGSHPETLHERDALIADSAVITGWTNPADTAAEVLWVIAADSARGR